MSALTYSWHVSNVQCVGSTTRPLPSHSAQVKETRRSVYDSESGVKKMAVGHHLSERSHTIESQPQLALREEGREKGLCQLGGRWVRVGMGPGWSGGWEWVWDQREWGGCLCQETVPICTSAVFERRGTRAGPTAGQPSATIRSSLSLGQHR